MSFGDVLVNMMVWDSGEWDRRVGEFLGILGHSWSECGCTRVKINGTSGYILVEACEMNE